MGLTERIDLLVNQTATASGNSGELSIDARHWSVATFYLILANAHSTAADTLDVYLQHGVVIPKAAGGGVGGTTIWDDFVHFTQVLGNGSDTIQHIATWNGADVPGSEIRTPQDAAMAVGVLNGPISRRLRVKWTITDDSGSATFTFSAAATVWEDI